MALFKIEKFNFGLFRTRKKLKISVYNENAEFSTKVAAIRNIKIFEISVLLKTKEKSLNPSKQIGTEKMIANEKKKSFKF